MRYGGNTSCVEVRGASGHALVLDAGTGMRPLGVAMAERGVERCTSCSRHLHLDHLQGLGFFRPLFQPGLEIHIWGPPSPVQALADRIAMYLSPPLFPVRLADIPSRAHLPRRARGAGDDRVGDGARVDGHASGPDGRLPDRGGRARARVPPRSRAVASASTSTHQPADWMSGHDIAHGADVLLHDAQYGDDEYRRHVGWGHSRIGDVVEFARKADVDRLVLFHHDPYHTDDELEALVGDARRIWGNGDDRVHLGVGRHDHRARDGRHLAATPLVTRLL